MLNEKQKAVLIIALTNFANISQNFGNGRKPKPEEMMIMKKMLNSVMPAARILRDDEMVSLVMEVLAEVDKLPVSAEMILPDPTTTGLQ